MLLECYGATIDRAYIPPFQVKAGDFVVINIFSGAHETYLRSLLTDALVGKTKNENVTVHTTFGAVRPFKTSTFRRFFCPITVGEYLRKNANAESLFYQKIYEHRNLYEKIVGGVQERTYGNIDKNTLVHDLDVHNFAKMSIYSVLSKNMPIIFPLQYDIFNDIIPIILEYVKAGGTAIGLAVTDCQKNDCTQYIEVAKMNANNKGFSPITSKAMPFFSVPNRPEK
jgi:hypothetical protein